MLENAGRRPLKRLIWGGALLAAGLLAAASWVNRGHAEGGQAAAPGRHVLAVLPFEMEDNSGEVGVNRHDDMLARLTSFIGRQIADAGVFDVVDQARVEEAVVKENSGTYLRACNGCELDIAKSVGADHVMIGWLFKMSTLVMSLHVVVKDVGTGNIVYAKTFDFRGDNEKSWKRAAGYMVGALSRAEATN